MRASPPPLPRGRRREPVAEAAATLGVPLDSAAERRAALSGADPLVPKVRAAMLAMQRRAWEQGTAAQALLEWGDTETVVLLAKDAPRQPGEGRPARL